MRVIVLSICIGLALTAYGQDKPKPRANAKADQRAATNLQRGTEAAPFVIKILPPSEAATTVDKAEGLLTFDSAVRESNIVKFLRFSGI